MGSGVQRGKDQNAAEFLIHARSHGCEKRKEKQRQNLWKLLQLKCWRHSEGKKVSNDRLGKKQIEMFRTIRI